MQRRLKENLTGMEIVLDYIHATLFNYICIIYAFVLNPYYLKRAYVRGVHIYKVFRVQNYPYQR